MRGDPHPAAVRLCSCLPVRTHEPPAEAYKERAPGNHVRECVINGRRYESLIEAARQLGCNRETLRRALAENGGRWERPERRGGNNARAIIIGQVRYASKSAAQRGIGRSLKTLHAMLADGRALYAERHE